VKSDELLRNERLGPDEAKGLENTSRKSNPGKERKSVTKRRNKFRAKKNHGGKSTLGDRLSQQRVSTRFVFDENGAQKKKKKSKVPERPVANQCPLEGKKH